LTYSDKTYLDQIVDYTNKVAKYLSEDNVIAGLLTNNPNADVVNDEINLIDSQIFSYNYIPDPQTESKSYICIDTLVVSAENLKIKTMKLLVSVISHKTNMKIDSSFQLIGNRRDNLIRFIDKLIRGNPNFGIGKIILQKNSPVTLISVGNENYTAKQIVYEVEDFNIKGSTA